MNFTDEQNNAIGASGRVIVSASAGSGKTAVMIERLVQLILGGVDVKNVLAVTFTIKAAAQMKEKLRAALLKRLPSASMDERARIKEQLSYLPVADISTIHSFCARIVRANFFLADVEPGFKITPADSDEGSEIRARALMETFEEAYEQKDENLFSLLAVYFHKKKDDKLREMVLKLYLKYRELPNFYEALENTGKADEFDEACAYVYEDALVQAKELFHRAEELLQILPEGDKLSESCGEIIPLLESVLKCDGLFALAALPPAALKNMPKRNLYAEQEALYGEVALTRNAVKELYAYLRSFSSREEEYERYLDAQSRARALASLVLKFDKKYRELKWERSALDYGDLEECAVKVLSDEQAQKAIRERYQYVFVDEYQDVNVTQEKIISLVGGKEVFLVGDRKQAIYGFRGSKSEYFTKKTEQLETSLVLSENFRSASAILDAVNRVFSGAMTEGSCGFAYKKDSVMRGGSRFGEHKGKVQFLRYAKKKNAEERGLPVYSVLTEGKKRVANEQSLQIAKLIESLIGAPWFDADAEDGKREKRLSYGDIAILVRKESEDLKNLISHLSAMNIPVKTPDKVDICTYWEIRLLIDWLSYLDNAEQDIPLVTAMLSSLGGFCEEELAKIRLANQKIHFFRDACREYAKMEDELALKLRNFFLRVEEFRAFNHILPAREVLVKLLAEGLEGEIAAKRDGSARLRRVNRFLAEAEGSVNRFLARIRSADFTLNLPENGGENAVQVVTMHSSKGLEYPVVILPSLDNPFHRDRDDYRFTEKFLISTKSYDIPKKTVRDNVLRHASAIYQAREDVKGELNLLYVAMTRARNELYMLFERKENEKCSFYPKSFAELIDQKALADYFTEEEFAARDIDAREWMEYPVFDEKFSAQFHRVFQAEYSYAESVHVPVKSSASELMASRPRAFVPEEKTVLGGFSTQQGTAYHAFLERVEFGKTAIEELERMRAEGALTPEQIALLNVEHLQNILDTPPLNGLKGKRIWREQRFLVLLQWDELNESSACDEVVFQGAIDLLVADGDGAMIVDYKFSSHGDERIRADYAQQIALYKKAVARAWKIDENKVRASILNIAACREIKM